MPTVSVRSMAKRLGRTGPVSVRRDVFGAYGVNPRVRSLKIQCDLIENWPFVRIALVTVRPLGSAGGQYANLQRDLDAANDIWQTESNVWLYCTGTAVDNSGILGANAVLDQNVCLVGVQSSPTAEETALFNLGRNLGANLVGYFVAGSTAPTVIGCATYPAGQRGFWVGFGSDENCLAHELTHVIGLNAHVDNDPDIADTDTDNLMWSITGAITNLPPDLENVQVRRIRSDPGTETV